jgi:hypothetical protein
VAAATSTENKRLALKVLLMTTWQAEFDNYQVPYNNLLAKRCRRACVGFDDANESEQTEYTVSPEVQSEDADQIIKHAGSGNTRSVWDAHTNGNPGRANLEVASRRTSPRQLQGRHGEWAAFETRASISWRCPPRQNISGARGGLHPLTIHPQLGREAQSHREKILFQSRGVVAAGIAS